MGGKPGNDQHPQSGTLPWFAHLQLGDEPPGRHGEKVAPVFFHSSQERQITPASPHLQTAEELRDMLMGTVIPQEEHRITINISSRVTKPLPASVDWRSSGMVSEVKSQVRSINGSEESQNLQPQVRRRKKKQTLAFRSAIVVMSSLQKMLPPH